MRTREQRQRGRMKRAKRRAARHGRHYDDSEFDTYPRRDAGYGVTLYRSRCGMICGVCAGVANYYCFSVFWTRVLFIVVTTSTLGWPGVFLYFIAAMVMKVEPVLPLESEEDEEFYHSYSGSRSMALQRLKRTFESLDRRIQRIENTVTTRDFDWEERLNS